VRFDISQINFVVVIKFIYLLTKLLNFNISSDFFFLKREIESFCGRFKVRPFTSMKNTRKKKKLYYTYE